MQTMVDQPTFQLVTRPSPLVEASCYSYPLMKYYLSDLCAFKKAFTQANLEKSII